MGAYSYSGTAASNTTVDGIGAAGSDSPDNIDNLIRTLAASDQNLVKDLGGANTVGGSADAITVALADISTPSYADGMIFSFRAASDTTSTTPTLNVDSLGAKTIKRAIQGVESALIAGDIQAGQTCQVVYRSAWASAAGAFELLNPSIDSQIELGHATDTTLTRSAAGVMAIEGGAGSLYAATIELGAASDTTLSRSSAGVVAVEGVRLQRVVYTASQSTSSGTVFDFTNIPSWVREIDVVLSGVSLTGTDQFFVQIGTGGSVVGTTYVSVATAVTGASSAQQSSTSGLIFYGGGAARSTHFVGTLRNVTGNTWTWSGQGYIDNSYDVGAGGSASATGTLDIVRLGRSGSDTFDAGNVFIICRG